MACPCQEELEILRKENRRLGDMLIQQADRALKYRRRLLELEAVKGSFMHIHDQELANKVLNRLMEKHQRLVLAARAVVNAGSFGELQNMIAELRKALEEE